MVKSPVPSGINIADLFNRGKEIYEEKLKGQLEPKYNGKYVAIEVDSGEHFIGETKNEASESGKERFPDKMFVIRRIGELEKISHHSFSPFSPCFL